MGAVIVVVALGVGLMAMGPKMDKASQVLMKDVKPVPQIATEEMTQKDSDVMVQEETEAMAQEETEAMAQEETKLVAEMGNKGDMASSFDLVSLRGEKVSLSSLKGEKVYVKFWASWCSICLAGLEDLDALAAEDKDFRLITIVAPGHNGEQDRSDFEAWFKGLGYKNIEVLLDTSGDVQKAYGVRAFPTAAYIGSDGILIKVVPGHMDNDAIKASFDEIY